MDSIREAPSLAVSRFRLTAILIAAFSLTAAGALLWTQFSSQEELRRQIVEQSEKRALQVAGVMANQIAAALERADFMLLQAREVYAGDKARFRSTIDLLARSFPKGALLQISVAAADGTPAWSNLTVAGPVNIRDRGHFEAHLDGKDRLYISKPVIDQVSRIWSVQVSRPMLHAGRFAGVIVLSIRPEYFATVLAGSETSPGDVMTLVHRDGHFVARSRDLHKVLGRMAPGERPYLDPGAPAHGVFRAASAVDPSDKIFGWRRIPGVDLIVSAGIDTSATLDPLHRQIAVDLIRSFAIALLIVVLGTAIAVLLLRFARQQDRLALSEGRMAALLDELEERVRLRTAELESLVKELETLNYAVAHDLNTSLGVMSVNAGMLLHDLGEQLTGDARRVLGTISENAQLAARLLDDLMEHSRLGREPLERRQVAMRRAIWRQRE